MPAFKLTAKQQIGGSNGLPKGTTFQVLTPNGVNTVNAIRIREAVLKQFGKDLSEQWLMPMRFDIVKL